MTKDYPKLIDVQKSKIEGLKAQRIEISRRIKKAEAEIDDLEKEMVYEAVKDAKKHGCETDDLLNVIGNLAETEINAEDANNISEDNAAGHDWTD